MHAKACDVDVNGDCRPPLSNLKDLPDYVKLYSHTSGLPIHDIFEMLTLQG
jgi:hypothetical protein